MCLLPAPYTASKTTGRGSGRGTGRGTAEEPHHILQVDRS